MKNVYLDVIAKNHAMKKIEPVIKTVNVIFNVEQKNAIKYAHSMTMKNFV